MLTRTDFDRNTENLNRDGNVRIDSTIVCSEKKSTYRYSNNSQRRVAKIKIDGGLIAAQDREKCDWLLVNWGDGISFFIELKGSDLFKAISQITSTIRQIWNDLSTLNDSPVTTANARIVLSKNQWPQYRNDSRYKQFEKIIKQTNGDVRIEAQQMQEQC